VNGPLWQIESGGFVTEAEAEVDDPTLGTILSFKGRYLARCRTVEMLNGVKHAIKIAMSHGSILLVAFDRSCRSCEIRR
jgi:hypothetical protein